MKRRLYITLHTIYHLIFKGMSKILIYMSYYKKKREKKEKYNIYIRKIDI